MILVFFLKAILPFPESKCMEFEMGRVLLMGRWAPGNPKVMYCAARRTIEGGRNLRPEFWANPIKADAKEKRSRKIKKPKKKAATEQKTRSN